MNQIILSGHLFKVTSYGICLQITESVNSKQEFLVPIYILDTMKNNVLEYCREGDLVAVKAHFALNKNNKPIVVCEKVTFLSSKGGD